MSSVRTEAFTGFGDDPNWSVKFCVLGQPGADRDWVSPPRVSELKPATGHRTIRQYRGRDPWTIKLELMFDDSDALEAFDAMVGRSYTLRIPWGHTKRVGGSLEVIGAEQYLKLPGTYLESFDEHNGYISYPGGPRKGTAVFKRDYTDPIPFTPPVWPAPPNPAPPFVPTLPEPLLYLTPTLMRNRAGNVSPTVSGAVHSVTLDGAPAWLALRATTNLCSNPLFGTNATGWTATNGSIARSVAWAYTGTTSGLLTATGANAEASFAVTASGDTTISAYVRNNAASARSARIKYNGTLAGSAVSIPAGGEAVVTATVTGTGASAGAAVVITNSANGETFGIGHFMIQAFPFRTQFCPMYTTGGSLQAGDAWSGTPHASTSTRAAGSMSLAVTDWPYLTGCIYYRSAIDQPSMASGYWYRMFLADTGAGNAWELRVWDSLGLRGYTTAAGASQTNTRAYTAGASVSILLDWSTSDSNLTINGSTTTVSRGTPSGAASLTLNLMSDGLGGTPDVRTAAIIVYPRPLTPTERAYLDGIPTASLQYLM